MTLRGRAYNNLELGITTSVFVIQLQEYISFITWSNSPSPVKYFPTYIFPTEEILQNYNLNNVSTCCSLCRIIDVRANCHSIILLKFRKLCIDFKWSTLIALNPLSDIYWNTYLYLHFVEVLLQLCLCRQML